jgi:hypothetical protein
MYFCRPKVRYFLNTPRMHSSVPHSCCMPCPSHLPFLDLCNNAWRRVQVVKLLTMQSSPTSRHFNSSIQIFSPAPCSQTPSVYVKGKGKGKVVPVLNCLSTPTWRRMENGWINPRFLDLSTSWRWVVSFTPWPLHPRGKEPPVPIG